MEKNQDQSMAKDGLTKEESIKTARSKAILINSWQNSNSDGGMKVFFAAGITMIIIGLLVPTNVSAFSDVVNLYRLHIKDAFYMFGGISILCGIISKCTVILLTALADIYDILRLK